MKKILFLLCTLLGTVGAMADELTLTPSNGTYETSSGNYVKNITFSTTPAITVTASANNMDKRQTGEYFLWHSGSSGSSTYTFSVAGGYTITAFSVTGYANTSVQTLTTGSNSHEFAVGTSSTFTVTGLASSSASFTQTGANASGLKITSMTITVVKPTEEQQSAYNTVQGWITTIQGAEGLVTDATNYVSNAKESSEGSYAALLDGEYTTYFHSTWNNGPDEDHYLQATLPEAVDAFYFYFKKRSQNQVNRPTSITISGSNDNKDFTEITTINSGLPSTNEVLDYASSKIMLGASYKYIRFTVTATNSGAASNGHVFFTFSEFYLLPSNSHVDDAMAFYLSGKKVLDYSDDDIAQVNTLDLEIRSATLSPAKANTIAAYTIPDGKVGTVGYPTQAAWDSFVAAINAITIEDDFDTAKNAAVDALLASAKLANGVYKIRNYANNHYLYQDEADAIVTYAKTEAPSGNQGYWRITDNGDGTYAILDLYGHQLTRGNQSQGWSGVQNGNRTAVTTITRDYTNSNYKTSGDLVSFYLDGAHINTGYNTGSKVFVTTWTTGGLGSDANHWFFEPVDISELTAYTITITGTPENITMGDGTILANGTSTVYLSGADQILAPEVDNYELSKEVEGTTATINYTLIDYSAPIIAYLTEYRMNNIGGAGKIGYMQNTGENFTNLLNLLLTFQDPNHVYTAEDYTNLITYYEACDANTTLPETGKFYRFKANATGKYIGYAESGKQPMVDEADASIYYYTDGTKDELEAKHFLSYNGRYLTGGTGNPIAALGTTGATFNFYKTGYSNPTLGTCRIRVADDTAGSLIAWTDGYLNGWGAGDHELCEWVVEEVSTLPVTISAAGYATLCAPVALTIPEGVTANTVTIEDNGWTLALAPVTGTIPAGTPVVLEGEAGTYDFTITTDGSVEAGNVLEGTYAAIAAPNGSYILQNQEKVGFYQVDTETAQPKVPGFRAYIPADKGNNVKAFFFGGITDGIENVKRGEANGTIYNLAGQRMSKLQRGLNIVNGQKVILK